MLNQPKSYWLPVKLGEEPPKIMPRLRLCLKPSEVHKAMAYHGYRLLKEKDALMLFVRNQNDFIAWVERAVDLNSVRVDCQEMIHGLIKMRTNHEQ